MSLLSVSSHNILGWAYSLVNYFFFEFHLSLPGGKPLAFGNFWRFVRGRP